MFRNHALITPADGLGALEQLVWDKQILPAIPRLELQGKAYRRPCKQQRVGCMSCRDIWLHSLSYGPLISDRTSISCYDDRPEEKSR